MEPLISYSGLELSLVEIILGAALLLIGAIIPLIFARPRKDPEAELLAAQMRDRLSEMQGQQAELQGRIAQFAEDSAQRDTLNPLLIRRSETRPTSNNYMNASPSLIGRRKISKRSPAKSLACNRYCRISKRAEPLAKSRCRI